MEDFIYGVINDFEICYNKSASGEIPVFVKRNNDIVLRYIYTQDGGYVVDSVLPQSEIDTLMLSLDKIKDIIVRHATGKAYSGRLYHYKTLSGKTEVSFTSPVGSLFEVYIEKPSKKYGFKTMRYSLEHDKVVDNYGFSGKELNNLLDFCSENREYMIEYYRRVVNA